MFRLLFRELLKIQQTNDNVFSIHTYYHEPFTCSSSQSTSLLAGTTDLKVLR